MSDSLQHTPYELMAEADSYVASETISELAQRHPEEFFRLLPGVLQEIIHDSIEVGLGLADHFPTFGAPEILEAYAAGYNQHIRDIGAIE